MWLAFLRTPIACLSLSLTHSRLSLASLLTGLSLRCPLARVPLSAVPCSPFARSVRLHFYIACHCHTYVYYLLSLFVALNLWKLPMYLSNCDWCVVAVAVAVALVVVHDDAEATVGCQIRTDLRSFSTYIHTTFPTLVTAA